MSTAYCSVHLSIQDYAVEKVSRSCIHDELMPYRWMVKHYVHYPLCNLHVCTHEGVSFVVFKCRVCVCVCVHARL